MSSHETIPYVNPHVRDRPVESPGVRETSRDDEPSDKELLGPEAESEWQINDPSSITEPHNREYDTGYDAVAQYLKDISQHPRLTADQEVALAKARERGIEAQGRLVMVGDDPDKRVQLQKQVEEGDAARKKLIESTLIFVVYIARKYVGRGLPFMDLIQEGNIGLQRGVEKYDWRYGNRLSTYAYMQIRLEIGRAVVDQGRTIRLPAWQIELLTKLHRIDAELYQTLGREPTVVEIANRAETDPEKVREAFRSAKVPFSLETPTEEVGDDENTLESLIADPNAHDFLMESAAKHILQEQLPEGLFVLTSRQEQVIRMRFGLLDGYEHTVRKTGEELCISRQLVEYAERKALEKLRSVPQIRELRDYID